ncbi:MAG: hypothetical protein HY039_01010 [Nitrospirae bacterium]|nr:hypothetical protein [Nitrospirota bacterium]
MTSVISAFRVLYGVTADRQKASDPGRLARRNGIGDYSSRHPRLQDNPVPVHAHLEYVSLRYCWIFRKSYYTALASLSTKVNTKVKEWRVTKRLENAFGLSCCVDCGGTGKAYVAFATGDETQPASTDKEWVYIVPLGDAGVCPTPSGGQEAFWFTGKNGAGEQLAAGEKVLGRPLVAGGHMYFTTYTSTDACQLGTGKLYDLTLSCTDPSQITKEVTDLGTGVPSKAVLGPEGIYMVVSEGDKITIKKKDVPGFPSSFMKSWRQVY